MASEPLSRSGGSAAGGSPGSGRGSGALARAVGHQRRQALQRERHVADDGVPHRCPGGLTGVDGDGHQLGRSRPAAGRGCRGSTGTPRSRRPARGHGPSASRTPRRWRAAARRRSWDGARGSPAGTAGGRAGPHRQPLLLGQGDGGVPAAGGVDVRPGDHHRRQRTGQALGHVGQRGLVGGGAAGSPGARWRLRCGPRRPRRSSRPWGWRRTPGPWGAASRGGWHGRSRRGRPGARGGSWLHFT